MYKNKTWLFMLILFYSCVLKVMSLPNNSLKNGEYVIGSGKTNNEENASQYGEKGQDGYTGKHFNENSRKGFHDVENSKNKYEEKNGNKNVQQHKDGYYKGEEKLVKGQDGYDYLEKGSYAKGHSTKGKHNVHKLNEFQKKTDFLDEDHDENYKAKHVQYDQRKNFSLGENNKTGHSAKIYLDEIFGKFGFTDAESHKLNNSGYEKNLGDNAYFKYIEEFIKSADLENLKKYGFKETN